VIPDGEDLVVKVFRETLAGDPKSARLRSGILARIYTSQFSPADVVAVFKDILDDTDEHRLGGLLGITCSLPIEVLPDILDHLCDLLFGGDHDGSRQHEFEVESAFCRVFFRALESRDSIQPERLWRWLLSLYRFRGGRNAGIRKNDIQNWLSINQSIVLDIFEIAYDELNIENKKWRFLYEFQGATMFSLSDKEVVKRAFEILKTKDTLTDKDCFLYQICGVLIFGAAPALRDLLEDLLKFADAHEQLHKIRENFCRCEIESWQRKDNARRLEHQHRRERVRAQIRANLEKTIGSIRSGRHLNNLGFLSKIYFGLFSDIENELSPIERLRTEIGDELVAATLEGFSAIIRRNDYPSPNDVASLNAKGRYFPWWYAIIAGMDEAWQKAGNLGVFSDTLLQSALAIEVEFPTHENDEKANSQNSRQWKEHIFEERPDLVESVFEDLARAALRSKKKHISILYDIVHSHQTRYWRSRLALRLLSDFPSASPECLRYMVLAAIFDPECHNDFLELSKATINARGRVRGEQRAIWLVAGFLLSEQDFQTPFVNYAKPRDWVVWIVREIVGQARVSDSDKPIELSVEHLETVIRLVGEKYKNVSHPTGILSGNRNPWNASDFVLKGINALSAIAELDASYALKRLLFNDGLSSYHESLSHAMTTQATIRREAQYKQPAWSEVTEALRGGRPANVADLHALILYHLETLRIQIRQSNTDIYKAFWRCNARGAVERPEIEDICRDRLIDLLKPRLIHLDIHIEPEAHMAADKRADIVILLPGQKLPLELKRDTHADLWHACESQLERLYTRDPEAEGYGIYVVFWFGNQRAGRLSVPPTGIDRPESANDLEIALRSVIPNDKRHYLEAIVFDVTTPAS